MRSIIHIHMKFQLSRDTNKRIPNGFLKLAEKFDETDNGLIHFAAKNEIGLRHTFATFTFSLLKCFKRSLLMCSRPIQVQTISLHYRSFWLG